MLKRLFISLIILSALTSDGAVNIQSSIYSLYLGLNNGYMQQRRVQPQAESLLLQEDTGRLLNNASANSSFILSSGSLAKLQSTLVRTGDLKRNFYAGAVNGFGYGIHTALFLYLLFSLLIFISARLPRVMLKRSDLSPPCPFAV